MHGLCVPSLSSLFRYRIGSLMLLAMEFIDAKMCAIVHVWINNKWQMEGMGDDGGCNGCGCGGSGDAR